MVLACIESGPLSVEAKLRAEGVSRQACTSADLQKSRMRSNVIALKSMGAMPSRRKKGKLGASHLKRVEVVLSGDGPLALVHGARPMTNSVLPGGLIDVTD